MWARFASTNLVVNKHTTSSSLRFWITNNAKRSFLHRQWSLQQLKRNNLLLRLLNKMFIRHLSTHTYILSFFEQETCLNSIMFFLEDKKHNNDACGQLEFSWNLQNHFRGYFMHIWILWMHTTFFDALFNWKNVLNVLLQRLFMDFEMNFMEWKNNL